MATKSKSAKSSSKPRTKVAEKNAKKAVRKVIVTGRTPRSGAELFFLNAPADKTMEKMMTQGKTQMDKAAQDAANFGRENAEAFIKFGQTFAKGFEGIMREATALAQNSAEKQAQFIKQALSTKNLNEWAEVQNKMAQASFDDFMQGATKISELSVKLFTESVEPLNAQMSDLMKKASAGMAVA